MLSLGFGAAAALAAAGITVVELVDHDVLPGKAELDRLDGACSVASPPLAYQPLGPAHEGSFRSAARNRTVGYTIAYPPGHRPGDALPLVIMLHGYGGNHADALVGMSPAQAVAIKANNRPLKPMALATVDGGNGYWTPHPGDDPMAMVIDEFIPLCRRLGLGRPPQPIGTMGISMGGYGALLLAEKYPEPGGFDIQLYPSQSSAREAIEDRSVYGAFVLTGQRTGHRITVLEASAASPTVAQLLTTVGGKLASAERAAGAPATVRDVDVVPTPAGDPRGLVLSSAVLPMTICGVIMAVRAVRAASAASAASAARNAPSRAQFTGQQTALLEPVQPGPVRVGEG